MAPSSGKKPPRPEDEARRRELRTAGELVQGGGLPGAMMTLLYILIGIGFWSLVGWGLDHVLRTHWIVWVGAGIGACAGIYLVYLHMRPEEDDSHSS